MVVSYRPEGRGALGDVRYHSPPAPRRTIVRSVTGIQSVRRNSTVAAAIAPTAKTTRNARSSDTAPRIGARQGPSRELGAGRSRPGKTRDPGYALLDDLIHLQHHRPGDRQSERARGPEIDDQ